jgi:N-acetylneuraminic acid mutarotase
MTVGSWTEAPPLRRARAAHAVVAAADAIYALGGSGAGSAIVERFDGTSWRIATRLPNGPVNAPAAAVLGGRIYVIGGFSAASNAPLTDVGVYDPAAASWSSAAPLPAPRGGHAAVVIDGKIHVLGGGNSIATIADHSVYDPATNSWSDAVPLPRSEGSAAAVVFGGSLHAIGGRSGRDDYGDVYVLDAEGACWSEGPAIPPRGTAGAAVYDGAIYLFGGESQGERVVLGEVYRLHAGAPTWQKVTALPTPRNYARAVVFRNAVYVVGGSPSFGDSHGAAGSTLVDRYVVGD